MIMQMANLRVGVPDMGGIRGVPGITGIEDAPLSIGLRGDDPKQTVRLEISLGTFAALAQGQKSECASGNARGRGGLGALRQRSSPDLKK